MWLTDAEGNPRFEMAVSPSGTPAITFKDAEVKPRVIIDCSNGMPRVMLLDSENKPKVTVAVTRDDAPGLWLDDARGNIRADMDLTPEGLPEVWLFGATAKVPAGMYMNADGSPTLSLDDAKGFGMHFGSTESVALAPADKPQTSADSIIMFGKNHRVIWKAP